MTKDYAAPDWRELCRELVGTLEVVQLGRPFSPAVHQLCQRAREALAQPVGEVATPHWSEGICGDGAAILRDGEMIPVEEVVAELNRGARARAALAAEPVGEGPTDQQIADAFAEGCRDGSKAGEPPFLGGARAVLARYGHQPAPPAEGEDKAPAVTEVIAWLRTEAEIDDGFELTQSAAYQRRAAELLEQRHPTPVPVSERLPGPGDCLGRPTEESDAGWCWTYSDVSERWSFESVVFPRPYPDPPLVRLKPSVTHWLPAHALPLPQGEVDK